MAACWRPPPSSARDSLRQPHQRRRDPDLRPRRAGDRGRQPAQGPSRRDGADQAARRGGAAAGDRFSRGPGRDPLRQGPSRRLRADGRRLRPTGAVIARCAQLRRHARRRGVALRSRARPLRRRTAIHRIRSARRLPARRSRRSGGRAQGRAQGARPRRQLRQAALRGLHRGSLRPFALEDRRLHALPRPLPDWRDRARRRSCRHRRLYLRRLRTMRRRVPDRRRRLCAAAGRRADAQAARAAHHLS